MQRLVNEGNPPLVGYKIVMVSHVSATCHPGCCKGGFGGTGNLVEPDASSPHGISMVQLLMAVARLITHGSNSWARHLMEVAGSITSSPPHGSSLAHRVGAQRAQMHIVGGV